MNIDMPVYNITPETCTTCGRTEVWFVGLQVCDPCFVIAYMQFRYALDWPLTQTEMAGLMARGNASGKPEGWFLTEDQQKRLNRRQ